MYFDKEQWSVIGDDAPIVCAGAVSSTVLVSPRVGSRYKVCIRVPSGLFSFLRKPLNVDANKLKNKPVRFYLEEDFPGEWTFILSTLALPVAIELWPYKGLPNWAERSRCL